MMCIRCSLFVAICAASVHFAVTGAQSANAQVYDSQPVVITPVYAPSGAYSPVVYTTSYLAWRSAGYYGGNWGPYYYNPPQLVPYISPSVIWPNRVDVSPPVTTPYRR